MYIALGYKMSDIEIWNVGHITQAKVGRGAKTRRTQEGQSVIICISATPILTCQVLLDDLLHAGDHWAADVKIFLGDALLPGCLQDGGVHGVELGGRGRRQGPELVLLLLLLTHNKHGNTIGDVTIAGEKKETLRMNTWGVLVPWCSSCVSSPWCVCVLPGCSQCAQSRACISTGSLDIPGTAAGKTDHKKKKAITVCVVSYFWSDEN